MACYRVVEQQYSFQCTWTSLVGLTAGMLAERGDFDDYSKAAKRMFKRSGERRFLIMFVGLAQALAGATPEQLAATYPGEEGWNLRRASLNDPDFVEKVRPRTVTLPSWHAADQHPYLIRGYNMATTGAE